ncbi:hypothetical protein A2U01_0116028, partial [Trifolium medium]|nr:hypothetical protein [Trifolium medium]
MFCELRVAQGSMARCAVPSATV